MASQSASRSFFLAFRQWNICIRQSRRHALTRRKQLPSIAIHRPTISSVETRGIRFSSSVPVQNGEDTAVEKEDAARSTATEQDTNQSQERSNRQTERKLQEQSNSQSQNEPQEKSSLQGESEPAHEETSLQEHLMPVEESEPCEQSEIPLVSETVSTLINRMESSLALKPDKTKVSKSARDLMRHMVHPIVVVTSCSADARWPFQTSTTQNAYLSPYYEHFCAATVSSFTTVTLGPPHAAVSFNLKRPSRTLSGILKHEHFRVTFLHGTETGAAIAASFIKGRPKEGFEELAANEHWVGLWTTLKTVNPKTELAFTPTILGAGVRGSFYCKVQKDKCVEIGDHTIVVADVIHVFDHGTTYDGPSSSEPLPALSYNKRGFRGEAQALTPLSEQAGIWLKDIIQTGTAHRDNSRPSTIQHIKKFRANLMRKLFKLERNASFRILRSFGRADRRRSGGPNLLHGLATETAVYFDVWHRLLKGEKYDESFAIDVSSSVVKVKDMLLEGLTPEDILTKMSPEDAELAEKLHVQNAKVENPTVKNPRIRRVQVQSPKFKVVLQRNLELASDNSVSPSST